MDVVVEGRSLIGRAGIVGAAALAAALFFAAGAGAAAPETVGESSADAVAVDTAGGIVVAGTGRNCLDSAPECQPLGELRRFLPDGGLDQAFGQAGTVAVPTEGWAPALDMVLEPSGRIVVLATGEATRLLGFRPDGSVDASFGDGGVAQMPDEFHPRDLAVDPAGRLLLAGGLGAFLDEEGAVARFTPDGLIDTSFGTAGIAAVQVASNDRFGAGGPVAARPDGGAVLVGTVPGAPGSFVARVVAVALEPDGDLDHSYGDQGVAAVTERQGSWRVGALATRADGSAVISANPSDFAAKDNCPGFTTAQLTPAGALEPAFGNGGLVSPPSQACPPGAADAALGSDGDVTVVGSAGYYLGKSDFTAVRYGGGGALDPGFGSGGMTAMQIAGQSSYGVAAAAAPDGATITVGDLYPQADCPGGNFCSAAWIVRQRPDGSLDPGFGRGGVVTEPWAHLCPRTPLLACGRNLDSEELLELLRKSVPGVVRVAAGGLRLPVRCADRVEEVCRISLAVAPGPRASKFGRATRMVPAGTKSVLRVPLPPRRLAKARQAKRVFVRGRVGALHREPLHVAEWVALRAHDSR